MPADSVFSPHIGQNAFDLNGNDPPDQTMFSMPDLESYDMVVDYLRVRSGLREDGTYYAPDIVNENGRFIRHKHISSTHLPSDEAFNMAVENDFKDIIIERKRRVQASFSTTTMQLHQQTNGEE